MNNAPMVNSDLHAKQGSIGVVAKQGKSSEERAWSRLWRRHKSKEVRTTAIQGGVVIGFFSLLALLTMVIAPAEIGIADCVWLLVCFVVIVRSVWVFCLHTREPEPIADPPPTAQSLHPPTPIYTQYVPPFRRSWESGRRSASDKNTERIERAVRTGFYFVPGSGAMITATKVHGRAEIVDAAVPSSDNGDEVQGTKGT